MEKIDAYKLLEQHAVEIAAKLKGTNSTQWAVRITLEDEAGWVMETALRIVFVEE